MTQFPSIFNDVIGPVMVGPSSSHTAASVRIGNVIRQITLSKNDPLKHVVFTFDTNGSLATTHFSQGSDIGLLGGLLGYETHDQRIKDAFTLAKEAGVQYDFVVKDVGDGHPNAYYIDVRCESGRVMKLTAISTGGGMFELTDYMGFPVNIEGGFFEALVITEKGSDQYLLAEAKCEWIKSLGIYKRIEGPRGVLFHFQSDQPIFTDFPVLFSDAAIINPVLPVVSQLAPSVPFVTGKEILEYAEQQTSPLLIWELAAIYESQRSGLSIEQILIKMKDIIKILRESLNKEPDIDFSDRILPNQAHLLKTNRLLGGSLLREVTYYVTRFMEIKSSMGVFVAAPTAGSCGCLSGTVFGVGADLGLDETEMAKAMLAGGLIGVLVAHVSTFAAEVCGCQAECGVGSGMSAGACMQIMGFGAKESLAAASMAFQNIMGMVCDPVANRVEVPCLGKNIMCAQNGILSANMAASGFMEVIPIDQTINVMDAVGRSLPRELRCTGLGGLSVTEASKQIMERLGEGN